MKDEEYVFYQDVREKKTTGYSARKQRTHCGKSGRVRFPSDNLTNKEIKNMSGECKSYRLNEPMKWKEFLAMPDEHKITYIKLLRQKYNAPGRYIAEMFGTNVCYYSNEIKRLGISLGKNYRGGSTPWDREGFFAWSKGIPVVKEEEPVAEEITDEDAEEILEILSESVEDTSVIEDKETVALPKMVIPKSGTMTFEGDTYDILKTIGVILGGEKVKMSVRWEVCDG